MSNQIGWSVWLSFGFMLLSCRQAAVDSGTDDNMDTPGDTQDSTASDSQLFVEREADSMLARDTLMATDALTEPTEPVDTNSQTNIEDTEWPFETDTDNTQDLSETEDTVRLSETDTDDTEQPSETDTDDTKELSETDTEDTERAFETDAGVPLSTDTSSYPEDCGASEILETFDEGIPVGWTIVSPNNGSGSGTASFPFSVPHEMTWHHVTVEERGSLAAEDMVGGYLFVGGFSGMDETLITDSYEVGDCDTITVVFDHYFDDMSLNTADRGELYISVDGPTSYLVQTFDVSGFYKETIDLSGYLVGAVYFQLKFQFIDENKGNYGWSIDTFEIYGE